MTGTRLEDAAMRLAERTLQYVGPIEDPALECDAEMRKFAKEVLALLCPWRCEMQCAHCTCARNVEDADIRVSDP